MIQNLFSSPASIGAAAEGFFSSIQKMVSGQRINGASDDAAGSAIVSNLSSVGRSERAAVRAVNDGMSILQGVDGAASQVQDNLVEMRKLAVAAASDTVGDAGRADLQDQVMQLRDAIGDIAEGTEFNGIQLADGSQAGLDVQAGPDGGDQVTIDTPDLGPVALGVGGIDLSTSAGARAAIDAIDGALSDVGSVRSETGGQFARLESAADSGTARALGTVQAASQISDADIAMEVSRSASFELQQNAAVSAQVQSKNIAMASAAMLLS